MSFTAILTGMGFGFFGRMFSMGLMNRPFFESMTGYSIYMTLGGGLGYWYKGFREDQELIFNMRYKELMLMREKREKALQDEQSAE
ncbi:hypothetical protein H4R33_000190 [Dimargaris cristalligena]|nr:hypothetical protein H4R33_000190 [Dimargaris cristalligena]